WNPTLLGGEGPERIAAMRVSANFFALLGVAPVVGRDFRAGEDTPSTRRVVVLSDRLWQRRFHGDARILGRSIDLSDGAYIVVGVMPRLFPPLVSEHFYQAAELWAPVGYDATQAFACRNCQHLKALGRLKRGVTIAAAERGVGAAAAVVPLLAHLTPVPIPRLGDARVDVAVLAFAAAVTAATTMGFGLLPAIRAARFRPLASLAGSGRSSGAAPNAAARRL